MLLVSLLVAVLAAPPPDTVGPAAPAAAPPDPVAQLVGVLARLPATAPLRARVDHRVAFTQGGEEAQPPAGTASATVTAGPDGLRIGWGPALLAKAEAEERARLSAPEAYAPTRDAVGDLRTLAIARAVDPVPEILRDLVDASFVEERAEVFEGAPARVVTFQIRPVIPPRDRRYVKDVEATARFWLGPDGVPLAEERHVLAKGRIFLIIGFEIEQRDTFRFRKAGDRLVVTRVESSSRSQGAGERRDRQAVTTLTILD
jgi:hypothetical protein